MVFRDLGGAILNPVTLLGEKFIENVPNLVGAIVVLVVGYIVALLIGLVVRHIFERTNLDKILVVKTKI